MKGNWKKAVSFVLALSLSFALNVSFAAAAEQTTMTGAQERPNSGIVKITNIEIRNSGGTDRVFVTGEKQYDWQSVAVALYSPYEGDYVRTFDQQEVGGDTTTGFALACTPEQGNSFAPGTYFIVAYDTIGSGLNDGTEIDGGYKVTFDVDETGQIGIPDPDNPPWNDIHQDFEFSVSPEAITLADSYYQATATPTTITLKNSGWEPLSLVTASSIEDGLILSQVGDETGLLSGESREYTVTPDTDVTPGAYSVTLLFTAMEVPESSAASVSVDFEVLKATQAGVTGWDTEAATTDGGLGKITGLTGGAVYQLGVDPYGNDDWTDFTAGDDGTYAVTPGAYQLRFPGDDFHEAGTASEEFQVPGFYNFNDTTIDDMKAGVDTNYPVCDLVTGGIGNKAFVVTAGALPSGLTLSDTGYITGAATVVTDSSFVIRVQVTDSNEDKTDNVRVGIITIAGIAKGDQTTPEALGLTESDVSISIDNWTSAQEYAASTDSAITTGGLKWKHWESGSDEVKALTGLSPNKTYIVFTRSVGTDLLNPSPIVTASALTLKTTIASVSISGSGILNEMLEAVVSPAAASVSYRWVGADGSTLSTNASIQVEGAMIGSEIKLEVTGEDDYQGTLTTEPYLVGGCAVGVLVSSYAPNKAITAVLVSQDKTISFSAVSSTGSGFGRADQTITFSGVNPNTTYDMTLSKPGYTKLNINGIKLENDDLFITSVGAMSVLRLYCGDFNGDDAVRLEDRSMLLQSRYYGKAVAEFTGDQAETAAMLDVDGDGYIKFRDLAIVMSAENYGRTGVTINY